MMENEGIGLSDILYREKGNVIISWGWREDKRDGKFR
jgi:hypothetical protein